jgi:hypothetical protein
MKRSTSAALLSGLVLPGLGQLTVLKRRKRGLAFMVPALFAFFWILRAVMMGASAMLDQAAAGADPYALAAQLSASEDAGTSLASWVLLLCWAGSIVDALLAKE